VVRDPGSGGRRTVRISDQAPGRVDLNRPATGGWFNSSLTVTECETVLVPPRCRHVSATVYVPRPTA